MSLLLIVEIGIRTENGALRLRTRQSAPGPGEAWPTNA
jgi:hypothetical protein